jgi:DNA-binding XRE family transcriptional regulator
MWEVLYLPEAEQELGELPPGEQNAVDNAVDKLKALGPALPYPHSSNVQGWEDLRELRPKAGKSPWRPLYRQLGDPFIVAAIGPEAKRDKRGFDRACRNAMDRLATLEADECEREEKESTEGESRRRQRITLYEKTMTKITDHDRDESCGTAMVKLSELRNAEDIRAAHMQDAEYRREHERTRLANDVAIKVIQFRVANGLSQAELGRLLGMRQPNVARLESGDHEPSLRTLALLAQVLNQDFSVEVKPSRLKLRHPAQNTTARPPHQGPSLVGRTAARKKAGAAGSK